MVDANTHTCMHVCVHRSDVKQGGRERAELIHPSRNGYDAIHFLPAHPLFKTQTHEVTGTVPGVETSGESPGDFG